MNRTRMTISGALTVLVLGAGTAPAATIIDLDPPFFTGGVITYASDATITDAGIGLVNHFSYCSQTAASTLPDTAEACATLKVALTPQPSITATLKAYPFDSSFLTDNANRSTAGGVLSYFFAVVGPVNPNPIPIRLQTFVEVDTPGSGPGVSSFLLYAGDIRLDAVDFRGSATSYDVPIGPGWPTGAQSLNGFALVNTEYHIELNLQKMDLSNAGDLSFGSQPGTAKIIIDPIVSFGPGFDSTGYSLAFSGGVGNGSVAAPEPATGALLAFAAVALMGRLRHLRLQRGGGVLKAGLPCFARTDLNRTEVTTL